MRISPRTDAVSTQGETRGRELPNALRPEAKSIRQFRQVMEETSVEKSNQRPRASGRPRHKGPVSQHETAIDFGVAQGLIPAFLLGGQHRQADLRAPPRQSIAATPPNSASISQSEQLNHIKEPIKTTSKSLPQPASVGHFPSEVGHADYIATGAAGRNTNSPLPMGSEALPEIAVRNAEPANLRLTPRDAPKAVEARQDAKPTLREIEAIEIQIEDKVEAGALSGAASRDRPDYSTQSNSIRARDSDTAVVVRNAASHREESTAGENAGDDNKGSRPFVGGQVEGFPDTKAAETGPSIPMNTGSFFALTAAKQISEFISKTISPTASKTNYAASTDSPAREKTLYLELHPESIGQVRLTLQLRGDALDIRIKAKSKEAAEAIEQDRGLLGRLLSEAGFRVSTQDIRIEAQATPGHDFRPDAQDMPGALAQGSGNSSRNGAEKHQPSWQQALKTGGTGIETPVSTDSGNARRSGVYL